MDIKRAAVIGAGTKGRGVTQALADAGIPVVLIDHQLEALHRSQEQLQLDLRMRALFRGPGEVLEPYEAVLDRIKWTTELEALEDADFVVENVPEVSKVKKMLYKQALPFLPDTAIIAINTSCISITDDG